MGYAMRSAEECLAKAGELSDLAESFEGHTRDTLLLIARTWQSEAERPDLQLSDPRLPSHRIQ
jgi:hypothetical protein